MKYTSVFFALALALLVSVPAVVKADDTEDLLNQLAAATSKDGNTEKSTQDLLKTLIQYCRTCLQEMNNLANDADSQPVNPAFQTIAPPAVISARAASANTAPAASRAPALQIGHVQPSGPLKEVHLDGYPALPNVPPVSSVTNASPTH